MSFLDFLFGSPPAPAEPPPEQLLGSGRPAGSSWESLLGGGSLRGGGPAWESLVGQPALTPVPAYATALVPSTPPTPAPAPASAASPTSVPSATPSATDFLRQHTGYAQQALQEAGLPAAWAPIMAGIAANETGYGNPAYSGGNRYFGIKATDAQAPQTGALPTNEVVHGQNVTQQARFNTYATPLDAHRGFTQFLRDNPRYAPALQQQDPAAFAQSLQQAGYATDPHWASKVQQIAQQAQALGTASVHGAPAGGVAQAVLSQAQQWLGSPYVFGGTDRQGVDCSGLIVGVMQEVGAPFAPGVRTAEQIRQASVPVPPEQAQPGDLVFFQGTYTVGEPPGPDGRVASHVGIVTDQGVMLDASGQTVATRQFGSDPYWQGHLLEIRRPPQYAP